MRPQRLSKVCRKGTAATIAAALCVLTACKPGVPPAEPAEHQADQPTLALMTSLPILWREGDIGAMLARDAPANWVRTAMEDDYRLVPLDRLTDLPGESRLVLAQPRALAPDENVALDDWVRGGGRVLVFADPMLTIHSGYALGDARAPLAMAMLSPILARWGLAMRYDPGQPEGRRRSPAFGVAPERTLERTDIPIDQAGSFIPTGKGHEAACAIEAGGLIARCRIGRGAALLVADAALIEDGGESDPESRRALTMLMEAAFSVRD